MPKQIKNKKLNTKSGEADVLKAQLARTLADYDNLVKRIEREKGDLIQVAQITVISKLLPVLDNLEAAQKHLEDQGLAISILEFKKVLSEEGLVEVKPQPGDIFNENDMEAVEVIDKGGNNNLGNIVAALVLPGWKFDEGRVIRHAKVKVAK